MISSYNNWPASETKSDIGIVDLNVTVAGVTYNFPGGCKGGDVHTIFTHFLPRYHAHVEPLSDGSADEWGYAYRKNRNADNLSCHASGTAVDVNAQEHPNGHRNTLTASQVKALRAVLAFYEGVLKWGGDFTGTPDEMHYEIHGDSTAVHRIAVKCTTPPAYHYARVLREGMHGADVVHAQGRLGVKVDGDFGPFTKTAVVKFQHAHGLVADGEIGPQTAAKLG